MTEGTCRANITKHISTGSTVSIGVIDALICSVSPIHHVIFSGRMSANIFIFSY